MRIIDISLPINNKTPIYPGNVSVSVSHYHKIPEYATAISTITLGSHTGTHIDAPAHAIEGALTLDKVPLNNLVGPCKVFDFSKEKGEMVTLVMLGAKEIKSGDRILLKTRNSPRGFKEFFDDYVYLGGDAADYLADRGVNLVGIDSLSIKKRGGIDHRPHISLLKKNIPILEGLDLSQVVEGQYDLYALPLNMTEIDGAPARAILVER